MSSYSDINQWLEEMGASDRSAGDPWTITRGSHTNTSGSSFSPAIVGDLGAPAQELTAEMQSAEQIAKADEVVTSPTGQSQSGSSKSSTGSGILGGFLSLFPVASVFGKLFGLGGSSSPPPLTPYIQPPSVNFEGAMSSTLSESTAHSLSGYSADSSGALQSSSSSFATGISSLSYGANGMPRTVEDGSQVTAASQPRDIVGEVESLTNSNFTPQPTAPSSSANANLASSISVAGGGGASGMSGISSAVPDPSSAGSSQGQSILVQVQAMDSQSFLDHSNDIAAAVRQAMLNMHSVNDVIADL
jgi:hypothetical protein